MVLDYYPMLASVGTEDDLGKSGWIAEPKLDGVRCLAYITDEVKLFSRVGKDMTSSFPDVAEQLKPLTGEGRYVLDGEIVAAPSVFVDGKGIAKLTTASFQLLQQRLQRKRGVATSAAEIPAHFIAFDVLEYAGIDVTSKRYVARRALLAKLSFFNSLFVVPNYSSVIAQQTYDWYVAQGAEGFMAKHQDAPYTPSARSKNWLKIKPWLHLDCFCLGATYGYGRRAQTFGALVLAEKVSLGYGDYEARLKYVGQAGTGFNDADLSDLTKRLASARIPIAAEAAAIPRKVSLEMAYLCEAFPVWIKYQERTKDNILRFPVYEGLA